MKIFLISHISDPDGITPVILSKLIFEHVDYLLVEACSVNIETLKLINEKKFDDYDVIYMTDLGLNKELIALINKDEKLKSKVKIFDHHLCNMFNNEYSFATIKDVNNNGKKQCGTSLYYDYLINNYDNDILRKKGLAYFVNLVREYDTWEWFSNNNIDAKRMAHLFDIYGYNYFIEHYLKFFQEHDDFFFDDKELFLLELEQHNIDNYIEDKKKDVIPVKLVGHNVGIIFASRYRSELGNALARFFEDKFDFIIVINIEHGISYRSINPSIDLNKIANVFGGKGHFNSSGSPLPKDIYTKIIQYIFDNKVEIDDNNNL